MKNKTSGFTLVELMVVILVVGLAVLLFTQIPLFSLSSWRKGSERLKMQRDAHYAMIRIQRKLRPASFTGDPLVSLDEYVGEEDYYRKLWIGGDSFYVDGDYDLVQNGDIVIISGEENTEFIVERNGDTINMELTLVRGNVDIILRTAVKPRN